MLFRLGGAGLHSVSTGMQRQTTLWLDRQEEEEGGKQFNAWEMGILHPLGFPAVYRRVIYLVIYLAIRIAAASKTLCLAMESPGEIHITAIYQFFNQAVY